MDTRPLALASLRNSLSREFGSLIESSRIPAVPCRLDSRYVAACFLHDSLTKKLIPLDSETRSLCEEKAISLFRSSNDSCRRSFPDTLLISTIRRIAEYECGQPLDWQDILSFGLEVGPGSSVGSRGQNSAFEKFFVNKLTMTHPDLYAQYLEFIRADDTHVSAEISRRSLHGSPVVSVKGSALSTVPKTFSIDRTICTEPSLNMVFQKSIAKYLDQILRGHYGYDSALQPDRNRALACLGSLDDSVATIDLSSASDTISLSLLSKILPRWLYRALCDCRSPSTTYKGETIQLYMVSSMGNGFTFSLETYIFSLVVKATALLRNEKFERFDRKDSRYAVFGDDIICPASLYPYVIANLVSLGFTPNQEKSFASGYFRESCGTDWYNGVNVRGIYVRDLSTRADKFSLINRLNRWSSRHMVPLPLTSFLPSDWQKYRIPNDLSDDQGVKGLTPPLWKNGYPYYALSQKKSFFRVAVREHFIRTHDNYHGALKMFSSGLLAGNLEVDRRPRSPAYVVTKGKSPYWNSPKVARAEGINIQNWTVLTGLNLTSQ